MIRSPSRRGPRGWWGLGWLVVVWLVATAQPPIAAAAPPSEATVANAKTLFKAGAQAYADGDFEAALHAFGAARRLMPDPALTFTMAQAHRRQHRLDGSSAHLRRAVTEYRAYLVAVPKGGRRGDAADALRELEPKLATLEPEADSSVQPARTATRLIVLSPVVGAQVSIDAAPAEAAPFIGEVEPGQHTILVVADGYQSFEVTVPIDRGDVMPINAPLEPLPARLLVRGNDGAMLWVDGRPRGLLPLAAPVAVSPGRRLIGVTQDGHRRFELEVHLDRDQRRELDVALETTAQRTVSVATLVIAGGSLVTGGVLAAVAAVQYEEYQAIFEQHEDGRIDQAQLADYSDSHNGHQPLAIAAIATGVAGVALGVTGGLLFVLDEAVPVSKVGRRAPPPRRVAIEVAPSIYGGHIGATVQF